MPKRVYCLYRVSTKGQVEKDDIPMQKQVCHTFAKEQGWEIVKEFSEKGVSGFKVSAKDRDAIQEIQQDAAMGKFDVLLVFMFDRLGRKEDETPFVVEWFVNNGVEVWSAMEGQQRFDTHVDKLMNYIRYWQASGESIKTSIRTKTRLAQIVQEGRFRGGTVPYGYRLVKKGRMGKKNRELYDIEVNPEEAPAVKAIFELAEHYGYGGRKISSCLREEGIVNLRTGEPFHYSSIQNILRNKSYIGILKSGETESEIFSELQIIEPELYQRVEAMREQRARDYAKKREAASWDAPEPETVPDRMYPPKNKGRALLSGNVYCGHCGGRIFATTAKKTHHATQSVENERIPIYKCYNRTQHKELCQGLTTYRAQRVDAVLDEIICNILGRAKKLNEQEFIERQVKTSVTHYQQQLKVARSEYAKCAKELMKWENLMLDSVEGNCPFTPEQVKRRMDSVQEKADQFSKQIMTLQDELENAANTAAEILAEHQRLCSWADIYADATIEEKKMVASYLIKAVRLTRDYGMEVEFNISEAQYLSGMEIG